MLLLCVLDSVVLHKKPALTLPSALRRVAENTNSVFGNVFTRDTLVVFHRGTFLSVGCVIDTKNRLVACWRWIIRTETERSFRAGTAFICMQIKTRLANAICAIGASTWRCCIAGTHLANTVPRAKRSHCALFTPRVCVFEKSFLAKTVRNIMLPKRQCRLVFWTRKWHSRVSRAVKTNRALDAARIRVKSFNAKTIRRMAGSFRRCVIRVRARRCIPKSVAVKSTRT